MSYFTTFSWNNRTLMNNRNIKNNQIIFAYFWTRCKIENIQSFYRF